MVVKNRIQVDEHEPSACAHDLQVTFGSAVALRRCEREMLIADTLGREIDSKFWCEVRKSVKHLSGEVELGSPGLPICAPPDESRKLITLYCHIASAESRSHILELAENLLRQEPTDVKPDQAR